MVRTGPDDSLPDCCGEDMLRIKPVDRLVLASCLVSALAGCMHAQLSRLVTVTIAGFFNEM